MRFLSRIFGRRNGHSPIKIAAGSTSAFPVISHTFVYQELTTMHEVLGADVKLFHTQVGDPAALHAAFGYLDANRSLFEANYEQHVADLAYFRQKAPAKVASLIDAIASAAGMPGDELEQRFEFLLAFTFARLVEQWGADYVHTYFFYDQALNGLVASWLLDIPRGVSTYADHMMADWPLKVVPLHLRTADVIVATSRRIAGELQAIGGDEIRDKIIVKPNGVDGARFPFVTRRPVTARPVRLICISRIEPKKGLLELADSTRLLRERGVAIEVDLIGGADPGNETSQNYAAELEARVRQHGLEDSLRLHGSMKQERMLPLLEQADAFIAPFVETDSGDKDGIPTAILEAISTGLPVIATDAGSIPEIIDDGAEGFVVPQRDPTSLADAVQRLATDPALAPRLGQQARRRFDREFDIRATEPRLHERVRAALRVGRSKVI